ncbi:MAG: stage II sporulation protein M [Candidatus Bathyarchaeia archaeon]
MALKIWKEFPLSIKRLLTVLMFFLLSIAITAAGVSTPLTREEATTISEEMKELQDYVSTANLFRGLTMIFGNNFVLCLSFFVPFAGPLFGFYALYSTGVVIAAQSISEGVNPHLLFLSLFILPFTWLEFLSYSTAFAESVWLTWGIIKRGWRGELMNTCIMVTLCAVMLLVAAFIEIAIIKFLAGT